MAPSPEPASAILNATHSQYRWKLYSGVGNFLRSFWDAAQNEWPLTGQARLPSLHDGRVEARLADLLDGTYDCVDRKVLNGDHSVCYSAGGQSRTVHACSARAGPQHLLSAPRSVRQSMSRISSRVRTRRGVTGRGHP